MALHELRYWNVASGSCSGSPYAYYPNNIEWVPELLGYNLQSRPIYGNFYEVHWYIDAMQYDVTTHSDGITLQGGWDLLDEYCQSGSPLCLKTVPKDSLTPETFSNVYMLQPTGTRTDINCYEVEVIFVHVEP